MENFELRQYQKEALDKIDQELKVKQNVLFVAATGAGKTVTICRMINAYYKETDRRFLILVNKQELVGQFHRDMMKKTVVPEREITICCAGLKSKYIDGRVTIATVQSFIGMMDSYPGADLVILDEVHGVTVDGEYGKVLEYLKSKKPYMRILGCTATPYRLSHGMIYGSACIAPEKNLFDSISHRITYQQLRDAGYLVSLRGKVAHADSLTRDLSMVSVSGDYVLNQLGEIMCREIHLTTAREAIKEHCAGFKRICVFCCTIDHAEKLKKLINEDEPCVAVHSQLTQIERVAALDAWKSGDARICTSINILAEGFDYPALDCLVFARPTLSARLFVQAIGRVLRTSPGKESGFLLDLTDNTARFGTDIDKIKADIPKRVIECKEKKDAIWKFCPQCAAECHQSLRKCESCGYEWPAPEIVEAAFVPEMQDVSFEPDPPVVVRPDEIYMSIHTSKNGKKLGKCSFICNRFRFLAVWFCMEDYYNGYAVSAGAKRWKEMGGFDPYPVSCEDFERRAQSEFVLPMQLIVDINSDYPEIKQIVQSEDNGIGIDGEDAPLFEDDCPF